MAYATATVLTIVSIAATVAAAGTAAYSSYAQGQYQKKAANYNAQVASNNALSSQQQASADAQRMRDRIRRIGGAQRAAQGKSGGTGGGSFADIAADTAIEGELDVLTTLYRGNVQAGGFRAESTLQRASGKNAATQGYYNAGAQIVGGVSTGVGNYYQGNPKFK